MTKITKTMKYQIIKPVDCTWELFGKILNKLRFQTRTLLNKTIQSHWEFDNFSAEYKKIHNVYPNTQEILGYKGVQAVQEYTRHQIKESIYALNQGNACTSLAVATSRWNTDKKDIYKGEKSIPSFKKNCPIDIKNKGIDLYKEDNNYYLNLSLISNEYKKELNEEDKELNRKSGQFAVLIKVGDNNQKTILDRCLSGEYIIASSKILQNKKKKWFINLSYSFEVEPKELNPENIMGIDMGLVYPVYIAFSNSLARYKIEGGEITQFRKQVEKRRNQVYKQTKYCGEGRCGHGYKTRLKPANTLSEKVSNFRDTTNHKYSKYIIDLAVKHNCGVIQMEDLTGISTDNRFLKDWSYYDLQKKIEYKAKEKGIKVVYIKPDFTSQRCSKCGYIHSDNRPKEEKGQSYFKCIKCDFETNADYNAAVNISTLNIDMIIEEYINNHKEDFSEYLKRKKHRNKKLKIGDL